ncbi:hypothetical protein L3Q82_012980, partial [Scortum barcoo]
FQWDIRNCDGDGLGDDEVLLWLPLHAVEAALGLADRLSSASTGTQQATTLPDLRGQSSFSHEGITMAIVNNLGLHARSHPVGGQNDHENGEQKSQNHTGDLVNDLQRELGP